jgi:hypothetical protein
MQGNPISHIDVCIDAVNAIRIIRDDRPHNILIRHNLDQPFPGYGDHLFPH